MTTTLTGAVDCLYGAAGVGEPIFPGLDFGLETGSDPCEGGTVNGLIARSFKLLH